MLYVISLKMMVLMRKSDFENNKAALKATNPTASVCVVLKMAVEGRTEHPREVITEPSFRGTTIRWGNQCGNEEKELTTA